MKQKWCVLATITLLILIPFVLFINTMPIMVSLSIDPVQAHYEPGQFEVLILLQDPCCESLK